MSTLGKPSPVGAWSTFVFLCKKSGCNRQDERVAVQGAGLRPHHDNQHLNKRLPRKSSHIQTYVLGTLPILSPAKLLKTREL